MVPDDDASRPEVAAATEHISSLEHVRAQEIRSVTDALHVQDTLGVLVRGKPGIGKSAFARACANSLGDAVFAMHFAGRAAGRNEPYGYLGHLLARIPESIMDRPMAMMQAVTLEMQRQAAGRPIVLILDNAASADDLSMAVFVHLATSGNARLLALTHDLSALPADLIYFLEADQLVQFELTALTLEQTRTAIRTIVGPYVGDSTVAVLHSSSGGNSPLLFTLVLEQLRTGNLVRQGLAWVLKEPPGYGGAVADFFQAGHADEAPEVRRLIEALALAQRLPLNAVVALFGAAGLSHLQDNGLVSIGREDPRWVTLRDSSTGRIVRGQVRVAQSRLLRSQVLGQLTEDMPGLSDDDVLALASWAHSCRAEVEPVVALAAARAAQLRHDPRSALRAAEDIGRDDVRWAAGQEVKARAHLMLQEPALALAVLQQISDKELEWLPPASYADYIRTLCEATTRTHGDRAVPSILEDARQHLSAAHYRSASNSGEVAEAGRRLEFVSLERSALRGEYAAMIPRLEEIYNSEASDAESRLSAGSLLLEALALTGRELDALALRNELGPELILADVPLPLVESHAWRTYICFFFAGRWRESIDSLAAMTDRTVLATHRWGPQVELARGLAYAYSGRGEMSVEPLLSSIAAFELRSMDHMLPLAYAAAAYAYAQLGDHRRTLEYLSRIGTGRRPFSWLVQSCAVYCEQMARLWLGDPDAYMRLIRHAAAEMERGLVVTAGIALMGSSVLGSHDDYHLIEECSRQRQGPLAQIGLLFAQGSRAEDPIPLLQAADIAAGMGLESAEAKFASFALDFARAKDDRASGRFAQQRLKRVEATMPVRPVVRSAGSGTLTAREREVALLAATGMINRDIAGSMGVSVRTVEGHLYQIFAKLGVGSRGELDEHM